MIRGALDRAVRWRHLDVKKAAMAVAPSPERTEPDPPSKCRFFDPSPKVRFATTSREGTKRLIKVPQRILLIGRKDA